MILLKKNSNPAVPCGLCLYSVGFGSQSISSLLFGTKRRRDRVKRWIETYKPDKRQPRNASPKKPKPPRRQPPWTIAKCGRCLFALGLGYHRVAKKIFGKCGKKEKQKVSRWIQWERPVRRETASDCQAAYLRIKARIKALKPVVPKIIRRKKWEATDRKLKVYLRKKVWIFFKYGLHPRSTAKLVGCSRAHFQAWIEAQFTGRMSMANYAKLWELDHIRPCFEFNLRDVAEREKCFHYTNFQPMLIGANRRKSAKTGFAAQVPLLFIPTVDPLRDTTQRSNPLLANPPDWSAVKAVELDLTQARTPARQPVNLIPDCLDGGRLLPCHLSPRRSEDRA